MFGLCWLLVRGGHEQAGPEKAGRNRGDDDANDHSGDGASDA
jgi:hypothetical protein